MPPLGRDRIVEKETLIAVLGFSYCLTYIDIYDPSFLSACSNSLDKLQKVFKFAKPKVIYHYDVNLVK